jgi:peptide/nickel transport system ATP-binding protein
MQQILTSERAMIDAAASPVLEVKGLKTYFQLDEGTLRAVDGVSLSLARGEVLAIVGESGCGKSATAKSIMGLIDPPGRIEAGQILLRMGDRTVDIARLAEDSAELRAIRGGEIGMIFQEPMTSFSPVHTIGNQIIEGVLLHRTRDKKAAKQISLDALRRVGMPDPERSYTSYPHELSGGLRQRAMIAMALACEPSVIIADEPTTALDVSVQWQILRLLNKLSAELGTSMVYITHDLGVVAQIAQTMCVMYLGEVVEYGPVASVFANPMHPYTRKLMDSIPTITKGKDTPLNPIRGHVPVPIDLPNTCRFRDRCDAAFEACGVARPALVEVVPGHRVRCYLHHSEQHHD